MDNATVPMKKMQVSDCLLMNIDFKLVKGSHETEKDIVDKSNNEANGIESGTVPRTNIQSTVWSKGQIERQTDGQTLEPVALLVPGQEGSNKRPPSPTADLEFQALTPPSKKRLSLNVQVDQPRIYDCVINSGPDKYSSGFVAFSKQIRPKVVEDNPSASYDTITRLVQEKWSGLSNTNKQHFCLLGKEEIENLKKTVVEKKKLTQKIKPKTAAQVTNTENKAKTSSAAVLAENEWLRGRHMRWALLEISCSAVGSFPGFKVKPSLPSIKEQLLAGNRPKGDNKAQIKTVKVNFSLTKLKQTYNTGIRESQTQLLPDLRLIGPLKFYNGWLCCHGNKIQVLNPHQVEETLLHRELLDKHVLPVTKLDNPVRLTESNVGGADLFCTLLSLFPSTSEAQTYTIATDERLVANGIQVRRHYNQDNEAVLDLMGLSQVMPMFGLADLTEILDLVCHTGATNLSMSRPLKVINYLQSEAVRMVRQRPLQRSRDDILDLVDQMMNSLPDNLIHCLHNKPFLHDLFDMKDAPSFPS